MDYILNWTLRDKCYRLRVPADNVDGFSMTNDGTMTARMFRDTRILTGISSYEVVTPGNMEAFSSPESFDEYLRSDCIHEDLESRFTDLLVQISREVTGTVRTACGRLKERVPVLLGEMGIYCQQDWISVAYQSSGRHHFNIKVSFENVSPIAKFRLRNFKIKDSVIFRI